MMNKNLKIASLENIWEFKLVVTNENNRKFNDLHMPDINDLPFLCEHLGFSFTELKKQIKQKLLNDLEKLEKL